MRRFCPYVFILLTCHSVAIAQFETSRLWSKTYGDADDEVVAHIIVQPDGNLTINAQKTIFADSSRNLFQSQSDAWMFGLDDHGRLMWDQTLGGKGSDTFYALAADPDSGFLLVGSTTSDVEKIAIWAVKTDATGRVKHRSVIPGDDDMAVNGGVSVNGRLIVCGREWAGLQLKWQAFAASLDEDLKVSWKRSVGEEEFDDLNSMVVTADGNVLALGKLGTNSGFHDLLIKLDPQGKEIWRRVMARPDGQYRAMVLTTNDGGFTTLGTQTHEDRKDHWIQKFSSLGKPIWEKRIPSAHDDSISNAIALKDGGYIVAGSRETQFPDERRKFNATLTRLTEDGTVVWQRSFPGDSHTGINGLALGKNGIAIAAGSVVDAETKNSDAWVFTFTLDGEFPDAVKVEQ